MNKQLNLFDILQNSAIGVIAIHSFILGYNKVAKGKQDFKEINPSLEFIFYVLPIIYRKSSLDSFQSSYELYTALSKDKGITLGLQERANKMSGQTFDSINLGFSKKIFQIDNDDFTIGLTKDFSLKSILAPMKISDSYIKKVRKASFQLGNIFAKKDKKMIQISLNVRF